MTLKLPWRDGTTHLCFEPITLLERLAALTPRPRINLMLYHGVLAPRAKWRAAAVAYGRADAAPTQGDAVAFAGPASAAAPTSPVPPGGAEQRVPAGSSAAGGVPVASASGPEAVAPEGPDATVNPASPRRWRWADLLQRVFAVDVLVCPNCGGRMRVIATIEDPRVVRRILTHLGLAGDEGLPADLADP